VRTLGSWLLYRALTAALVELDLLSWDSSGGAVSKPRLAPQPRSGRRPPLHRPRDAQARPECSPTERPLPHASPRASVSRNHPRDPVPSSWFHTTSTVSSARRSRACCIPLPVMGFVAFLEPDSRSPTWQARSRREDRIPPRDALSHPPKAPSIAAVPRHRGRCPLAVGRQYRSAPRPSPLPAPSLELHETGASTSRRCSAVECRHRAIVADRLVPCPSMGFVPLRGPSRRTQALSLRPRCR